MKSRAFNFPWRGRFLAAVAVAGASAWLTFGWFILTVWEMSR